MKQQTVENGSGAQQGPPDLSLPEVRARLSPSAIKAFMNIVRAWKITTKDACNLLGGVSSSQFFALRKNPTKTLGQDQITRVSFLVGIFKALNILHNQRLADEWVSLPNSNRIFNEATPLAYMIQGGLPAIQIVRQLLDARRGGLA